MELLKAHTPSQTLAFAPGRVNLMGDHTDYNQGFVLPITLEQGVYVQGGARTDSWVRVYSENFEEEVEFDLEDPVLKGTAWHHFVRGMVGEMHHRYTLAHGFDAVIFGDVPVGSGLSSSAAIEVALLLFIQSLFDIDVDPVEGALLCQGVEHNVIGLKCGIMDQFASRLGRAGHALYLDCQSRAFDHLSVELLDKSLLIVDSRAPRSLAASKYNERRDECDRSVVIFQQFDKDIKSLRDVTPAFFETHKQELPEPLRSRSRHVVYENERVLRSAEAFKSGSLNDIGPLMNASHASLRDDYEVSCAELDFLAEQLTNHDGVLGARLTGAGFGGCLVSLVHTDAIPDITTTLAATYKQAHGREPGFLEVKENREAEVGFRFQVPGSRLDG